MANLVEAPLHAVETDANGLEVLAPRTCRSLIGSRRTGRVALSIGALPVVLPVRYALLGDRVVVRTSGRTALGAALPGAVVAFEVDDVDEIQDEGWSVLIQGVGSVLTDRADLDAAAELGLPHWGDPRSARYVQIRPTSITGRRFVRGPTSSRAAPRARARGSGTTGSVRAVRRP